MDYILDPAGSELAPLICLPGSPSGQRSGSVNPVETAVFVLDDFGRVVSMNSGMSTCLGLPLQAVVGHRLIELIPLETGEMLVEMAACALDSEMSQTSSQSWPLARSGADSQRYQITLTPLLGAGGQANGLAGIAFKPENSVHVPHASSGQGELRYRQLFEAAPVGLLELMVGPDGPVIVQANQRLLDMLGWGANELVGAPLSILCDTPVIPFPDHTPAADASRIETILKRKDGISLTARVHAAAPAGSAQALWVLTVEDITAEHERRSEEQTIAVERQRIAREIHDGIAQDLLTISLRVGLWKHYLAHDPAQMPAELDWLHDRIHANVRDIRRSIFALRPLALEEMGFLRALEAFIRDTSQHSQVAVELSTLGPIEAISEPLKLAAFRMIQEALHNMAKHAQAAHAWVCLEAAADELRIFIVDDGRGFDTGTLRHLSQNGHVGLSQMRERVELLGGAMRLKTQPGQGTRLEIHIPLVQRLGK